MVDHDHGDGVVHVVHIDLGGSALGSVGVVGVLVVVRDRRISLLIAVHIDIPGVIVHHALANGLVDHVLLGVGGVGEVGGVGHSDDLIIGGHLHPLGDQGAVLIQNAFLVALAGGVAVHPIGADAPGGAGTAVIGVLIGLVDQVEVLVAQGIGVVVGQGVQDTLVLVVVHAQQLIVLNGHSLGQGVEHQLSHVVAGQTLVGGQLQVAVQAQSGALGGGGQHPVTAEVSGALEVAQGAAQHQHGLRGGHGGVGVKLAVAHAGHDAQAGAQVHIALRPGGDVGEHIGLRELVDVHTGAIQHGADDDRHLGAGDYVLGAEGPVLVALEHADGRGDRHGILIDDLGLVGEIVDTLSAGTHDHHAQEHNGSQSQAESTLQVSHWIFLLFILTKVAVF